MVQPPPSTQAPGARPAQYAATASRVWCLVSSPSRLQRRLSRPPATACTCASPKAGSASRPRRSITRVPRPANSLISSSAPTARIVPPRTARACAKPDGCAGVRTFPPTRTRFAIVPLAAISSSFRLVEGENGAQRLVDGRHLPVAEAAGEFPDPFLRVDHRKLLHHDAGLDAADVDLGAEGCLPSPRGGGCDDPRRQRQAIRLEHHGVADTRP